MFCNSLLILKAFIPTINQALLNKTNQFQLISLDPENNTNTTLPVAIKIQAYVLGYFINVTLNQIEGVLNNASRNNNVYLINDDNLIMNSIENQNLVILFNFI